MAPGRAHTRPGGDQWAVRRAQRLGLLGAVLVLLAFGTFNVFAIAPFYAGDETAHTDYALEVASANLPTFESRYPDRIPGMSDQWPTMTAVHPPLYYLLAAVPLRTGIDSGHPLGGLRAARLLTLGISVLTVVLVARLAAVLAPGRPRIAVASAALLASLTSFQQVSAFVYNDALAVCTVTVALVAVARVVRTGCDRRGLGLLLLGAVLAAATRSSGLEVAALACLAAACPPPGERSRPWRRRLPSALGRMAVVVGAVALSTGWFYLRNTRLYGDPAGSARAIRDNPPGPAVLDNSLSWRFWLDQWSQLWGYVTALNRPEGGAGVVVNALLAAVVVGLALAGWAEIRRGGWRTDGPRPYGRLGLAWSYRRLALAWLAMGAHAMLVTVTVLVYFSHGAIPFGRYFFPLLPLLPVLMGLGLAALPGRGRAVPTALALVAAAGVSIAMTRAVLLTTSQQLLGQHGLGLPVRALALGGVPAPGLALAVLAVVLLAGLALLVVSLARLPASLLIDRTL